jgi:hypothetical protein
MTSIVEMTQNMSHCTARMLGDQALCMQAGHH